MGSTRSCPLAQGSWGLGRGARPQEGPLDECRRPLRASRLQWCVSELQWLGLQWAAAPYHIVATMGKEGARDARDGDRLSATALLSLLILIAVDSSPSIIVFTALSLALHRVRLPIQA